MILRSDASYSLKKLYESYGYSQYKMSRFEEYELYLRNKSFLVSDHIIAFTDTDGKLMALKPDVTLSIVKGCDECQTGLRRVYYDENVYRVPRGAMSFKEIRQAGLECIGELDEYAISEVLTLAVKSLESISHDCVLDVSDMGIVASLTERISPTVAFKARLLSLVAEKNIHELKVLCAAEGRDPDAAEKLIKLISLRGGCDEMLEILRGDVCFAEASAMARIVSAVSARSDCVKVDFSVTDDMKYYNGIVFKGFIKGIPSSVLSGGRYDNLMKKMGKQSGAIGFAVYLDLIGDLDTVADEYDVDTVLIYDDSLPIDSIMALADSLRSDGSSVRAVRELPSGIKYRRIVDKREGR
ncbi:MAG: hypothetical protein E7592_03630 [Ruminococcaceae bacterium]|nr:hypothetical protein [Oscillospiraceae bacterium]